MSKMKSDHPTTGEIVVRDFEAGKIPNLAKYIDKLLNKELLYGIQCGKLDAQTDKRDARQRKPKKTKKIIDTG